MPYAAPPTKIAGDVLTSALWNSFIRDNLDAGVMRMIGDSGVLVSDAANVDLQSLHQGFGAILIIAYLRGDTAASFTNVQLRLNNDSGTNYDYEQLNASAASPAAAEAFAPTSIVVGSCPANTAPANLFNASAILIPSYAGAVNNKSLVSLNANKVGTSTGLLAINVVASFWRSNAAINRVTILPGAGNLRAGSRVFVLGLPV